MTGRHFASRVSTSPLQAEGLAELNDTAKVSALLQAVTGQHPAATASIPARQNRGKNRHPFPPGEIDAIRQLIDKVHFDAEATARGFIEQGRRL